VADGGRHATAADEGRTPTTRLARLRVPLGFLFGALVLWIATPTERTLAWGAAVACVGEALRIWAAGHLNKAREVTTSGPYRWLAHPLYTGSSIMGAGLAIASGSLVSAILIAIYLGVTLTAAVWAEEAMLRRRFGDRYDQYRSASYADAASARSGTTAEVGGRRFRLAQALANREHRAIVGLAIAILLLTWKASYNR
jgi:hypothetical protein